MKRISLLFVMVLLALVSCKKYETYDGDPLKTKIYTLDNGLKVYMSVNKDEPRMQTAICVRVGGKNDPAETTGMAHYFEHLMFKGTQKFGTGDFEAEKPMLDEIADLFEVYRVTTDEAERAAIYHKIDSISYEASKISIPNEYDKLMSAIGASGTNAFTSQDMTCYVEDIPANQIENWARIQADRFENAVIRGFHTELETIYEEKNMSLTQDNRKVNEALDAALFPHHPYGTQTVLGTQEHLKNPSIKLVQQYHDTYYVPNNMAICVSGDFDPDNFVKIVEKYFGGMQPKEVPELKFEPEPDITEPVVKEVYGLEAESVTMAWRLPGVAANPEIDPVAEIASSVLFNGTAGLIDLDVNQQQKALGVYAFANMQPDYGCMMAMGRPKEGQTLEEVRDIVLAEVAKLCAGDFTEEDVKSCINNARLQQQSQFADNSNRALQFAYTFGYGIAWKDVVKGFSEIEKVTKEDVVDFANKYLCQNNYAVIYKRVGEDPNVQKISAPAITPIFMNRDASSDFLKEIVANVPKPIEPVFLDFSKDLSISNVAANVDLIYKENTLNDIFTVQFVFNSGSNDNPVLSYVGDYLNYLGTDTMSAQDIARKMYSLACDYNFICSDNTFTISITGLKENMGEAIALVENLIANAQPDEDILLNAKYDILKARQNRKMNQRANFQALVSYIAVGPEKIKKITLTNEEALAVTSEQILGAIRDLVTKQHEIYYYGPDKEADVKACIAANHTIAENPEPLVKHFDDFITADESKVFFAQYDARQLYYYQISVDDRKFDRESDPARTLYNEYFGGNMNAVVFQEMREARGLAYSAQANMQSPHYSDGKYLYGAFIATQNDKLQQAVEAFAEIINNMPVSENAFAIAKDAIITRLRTERTTGMDVIREYVNCRDMGLDEPLDRELFEKVQDMTINDVVAYQQEWVKDRKYSYGILGDQNDMDIDFLRTLGPVKFLTSEEIFGY
ncbi:MAG: insulinase family protein [Bacteroidales bacterium]|nr:insulinase family protein [Bacteroidales bacterium]